MAEPVVTFLSDFGHEDEFVGVCHGVIARRCPAARLIDVSHGVPPQDIRAGALMLRASLPYLPAGIHLAIVDPGVGVDAHSAGAAGRRAVALATEQADRILVGPDNGLLWPAAEQLGGVRAAADIGASRERLEPLSATFHGRDIFAPVAAALACGLTLEEVGEPIASEGLTRLALLSANVRDGALHTRVLDVDRFGNLTLDATLEQLSELGAAGDAEIEVQGAAARASARRGSTFGDVPAGGLVAHEDSRRLLALAVNRGSAASLLGARAGDELARAAPAVSSRGASAVETRPPALGLPRIHRRRTGSTNELARELAAAGAPHGTLVTASEQTAGRGRYGRTWWAPPGDSLLMSLVLRQPPSLLPLAAAVAVCDAVREMTGVEPLIKWPNDVVLEEAGGDSSSRATGAAPPFGKLAGILIEGRPHEDGVVLGIGLNVAVAPQAIPHELRGIVATLAQKRSAIEPLLEALLRALERRLREPQGQTLDSWRERDALYGREIAWNTGDDVGVQVRGRAEGIDGAGRLVVARPDGSRLTLEAGEVSLG